MFHFRKNAIRIRNYISKVEIKKQLYIVYFVAGILPILIIGIYLLINTRNLVMSQHKSQAVADNVRVRSVMLDATISILNISDNLFSDKELHKVLAGNYNSPEDSYAACRSYDNLNDYAGRYTEVSRIYVYYNNPTMYDFGHFKQATDDIKNTEWYQKAENSWGIHWFTVSTKDFVGSVQHELVLVRKIPVISANDYAILFIGINGNYLKSRINTSPLITEVTVNDDPIFYSTNYSHVNQEMGYPIDYDQRYYTYNGIVDYDGEDVVLQLSTLSMVRSQDKLYIATIDNEAIANTNRITRVSALIVLISLLVPFIMVSIFTKTLSARIKTLRQEMHKVSTGDLNIIEDFKGNDELVDLYSDLKIMIAGIKRMDEEIYTERITKQEMINHQQEMQLEMLASKINPHFLFNTLETIRMKAYSAGDKEVATAIKLLGKSMRHVLETGGRMVSLKSELEYIAVYLDIQKLRFKDKINYDIVVGEDINTEEYKILPLLLQPVVENAFIHGLEDKEKDGYIRIDIKSEDNQMVVTVSDNGIGMDDEQLTVLLERIKLQNREDHSKSIGLHNVYQRIRLFYGDAYGMDIKSVKNKGTEVYIRLPVKYSADTSGKIS